jgi:hypothetical protein
MTARQSRKKVTTVTEEPVAEEIEYTEVYDDEQEENQLDALEGLIGEFTGAADIVVNVYRQGEGKNISFLFRTSPDEMSGGEIMERCRDNYGTGDYRIHIRQGPRIVHNRPFSVEAKKEPDPTLRQESSTHDIIALITAQNQSQQQMFMATMTAMAEALKGREYPPPPDPVAMQTGMIQAMVALKQLAVGDDGGSKKDPVDMLIQGITLANELRPSEGDTNANDLVLAGLKAFAPTITEATRQGMAGQRPSGAPGDTPAGALPRPGPGAPGQPGQPQMSPEAVREREMGLRQVMMRQQLGWLVKQASVGKHPDLYAELLLDQVGEKVVLEFIGKPDALQQLAAIEPRVQDYSVWFEELRAAILELTAPDDDGHIGSEQVPTSGGNGAARHTTLDSDSGDHTGGSVGDTGDIEADA